MNIAIIIEILCPEIAKTFSFLLKIGGFLLELLGGKMLYFG